MANLLRLLPTSSVPVEGQNEAAYLEILSVALADRKLDKQEANDLAKVAIEFGLSSHRVKALNASFLDSALSAAMEDGRLQAEELRNLKALAKLLGASGYFDVLRADKKGRQKHQTHDA
jgi:tellurite resistance protein